MGNPVLLKNVSKLFSRPNDPQESRLVVDRINLELKEGELLTLAGPRRSGKSTVLKMIAGLEPPTAGEIYLDGLRVKDDAPAARNVRFVVPGNTLFKHMTVADNIYCGIRVRNGLDTNIRRLEQVISIMGLQEVLDRSPDQLSRGQHRRVVLASALASQPLVLLLDDPFAGLDESTRRELRADTMRWQQELNVPIILATHDRFEAFEMGERIAILGDGRIQQIDTYRNLLNSPANDFVSNFISGGNVLAGTSMKALSAAGGEIEGFLPDRIGHNVMLPIGGTQRLEDEQEEGAIASHTFLGRPIRLEVRQHHGYLSR